MIREYVTRTGASTLIELFPVIDALGRSLAAERRCMPRDIGGRRGRDVREHRRQRRQRENIWTTLLPLASVIPKLLFTPGLERVLGLDRRRSSLAGRRLTSCSTAIPIIGQVFAVIDAVGDAVTLAEVCAETIVAPWVIENEVALTYPATVTINRDPRDATFPKTAVSYQLEAKVDGAVALRSVDGYGESEWGVCSRGRWCCR